MNSLTTAIQNESEDGKINTSWITHRLAYQLIRKWQRHLRLIHWTVRISHKQPQDIHMMEVHMLTKRQIALIRINKKAYALPRSEFEQLIVHELVHVMFNNVTAEHSMQLQYFEDEGRNQEYKHRMMNEVEKSVEHLAQVIYNQYS